MTAETLLIGLLVGGGLAAIVVGVLFRAYSRDKALADILDLPYGEHDVDVSAAVEQHSALVDNLSGLAGKMVEQFDERGTLATKLERARVPMRTGEFVVTVAAGGAVLGVLVAAVIGQWFAGAAAFLLAPLLGNVFLSQRINSRRKKFEAQFPDALTLIASSLSAGHTFLRAIQMMVSESEQPIADEFARVVNETQLGDPLVDALDRMAKRVDLRDIAWVVQAIRIQQQVGGKLAELLHTLADFIRAREELRREVDVLTAEGRISAWVLGALPVGLMITISAMNPGYMDPLFQGWGYVFLAGSAVSVVLGVTVIQKMSNVEV